MSLKFWDNWANAVRDEAERNGIKAMGSVDRFRREFDAGWTPEQVVDFYLVRGTRLADEHRERKEGEK